MYRVLTDNQHLILGLLPTSYDEAISTRDVSDGTIKYERPIRVEACRTVLRMFECTDLVVRIDQGHPEPPKWYRTSMATQILETDIAYRMWQELDPLISMSE